MADAIAPGTDDLLAHGNADPLAPAGAGQEIDTPALAHAKGLYRAMVGDSDNWALTGAAGATAAADYLSHRFFLDPINAARPVYDKIAAAGPGGAELTPQDAGALLNAAGSIGTGAIPLAKPTATSTSALGAHPSWISQRAPTAAKATEDALAHDLVIDPPAMRQLPATWDDNVALVRAYPNLTTAEKRGSTQTVADNFVNHVTDNLLALHDAVPPDIAQRSKLWYDGANAIARGAAERYNRPVESVAGVYAALSPQRDWFMNVSLGDRVMYIAQHYPDQAFTPAMAATAPRIFGDPKYAAQLATVSKGTLSTLTEPADKAMWLRIFDQAHHDPSHAVIAPEGTRMADVTTMAGEPARIQWGSLTEIGKAIMAFDSGGDRATLSALMGGKHKVRNFYNNILDPNALMGDVTIDTHAVAAGLLRPLSGHSNEVAHNFNNYAGANQPQSRGSAITGVEGTYGLYADAYRRAAAARGILPREMQSITWEAVRGLFSDVYKRQPQNTAAIDAMWNMRNRGASLDEIRRAIYEHAGGITPPDWYR